MNCLVVGLKGLNGQLYYDSEVPEQYYNSTENVLKNVLISKEDLKDLVLEMEQAGFLYGWPYGNICRQLICR